MRKLPLMRADKIVIHNARQNNLKGITVEIPRRSLTVITGPSGSGKSSLAFDTLYAEGQRRYMESLSTYTKQFLERVDRPDVGRLDGISPAVAIEQKNPTTSSRSTVGTATEVYDYLRLLWARIGKQYCSVCGESVAVDSPTTAAERVTEELSGANIMVTFPLPKSAEPDHRLITENLLSMGFIRILADDEVQLLDQLPGSVRLDEVDVEVVVDRIRVSPDSRGRLADSIATAFAEGEGVGFVRDANGTVAKFSQHPRCTECDTPAPSLSPAFFSFNNPRGACPQCTGFGAVLEYDQSLIVPDPERTLADGAIDPWTKPRYTRRRRQLREIAAREGISLNRAWRKLTASQRQLLLHGSARQFVGVFPFLQALERKRYKQYIRVFLRRYQKANTCPACSGARLRPEALSVKVGDRSISEVSHNTPQEMGDWIERLNLSDFDRSIAKPILNELIPRTAFLNDVGVGYLNLDRQTRTLSRGEAQRITLANALGANLSETLYVLDEPSIGLHPRDIEQLVDLLKRLRDLGNTVVVVEHDPVTIRSADHLIELGPGSGERGGELVHSGTLRQAIKKNTLTGSFIAGKRRIPIPTARRPAARWLTIRGAKLHNIAGIDVRIPLGTLVAVTGVSGSGKSTLVHDIIYRRLAEILKGAHGAKSYLGEEVGEVKELTGAHEFEDVVLVDQSPIGRSPRSNPITYVKAFDQIRELFAAHTLAKSRGYTPTMFSFNAPGGGKCRTCEGAGFVQIEMVFLADVFVRCEACLGTRYEPEVLDVKINNLTIHDVLDLTVDQAMIRFKHQNRLGKALWYLQQVGLGYLRLGQPATTLSGGEAQRLKIARQLAQRTKGRRLYILDEPTTGLHLSDIHTLVKVLDRLVDSGHTVIVIEHNLDLIKRADWVIDMGPGGGAEGGRVVAEGTPEQVAAAGTETGRFLQTVLCDKAVA